MIEPHHGWNRSYKPQFLGFVSSILITIATYRIVIDNELSDFLLLLTIFGFAIAQALIQLFFFLHLGLWSKPHWAMISFLFTVMVIVIVIGGSLWIMNNLNYDLMSGMPQMQH